MSPERHGIVAGQTSMARLRYRDHWFHPLSAKSLPEADFEDLLIQNSDAFRASSWMIRFKKTIYAADSNARPDLAIIDSAYREWFVVEVEMERHSLGGHVLPQVRTLRDGFYGEAEATYMLERFPHLDHDRLHDLVRGRSPRIVVIADRENQSWRETLAGADIELLTLEIYRSELNQYIFSVDGGLPHRASDLVSYCYFNQMLPRQLIVESPASLGVANGESLDVFWDEKLVELIRMDAGSGCYLRMRGPIRVQPGVKYALLRTQSGEMELKPIGRTD